MQTEAVAVWSCVYWSMCACAEMSTRELYTETTTCHTYKLHVKPEIQTKKMKLHTKLDCDSKGHIPVPKLKAYISTFVHVNTFPSCPPVHTDCCSGCIMI